jgi:hypothetical protein
MQEKKKPRRKSPREKEFKTNHVENVIDSHIIVRNNLNPVHTYDFFVLMDKAPIVIVSENNLKEHWGYKIRRVKGQKKAIKIIFLKERPLLLKPAHILLTKIGGHRMDEDNLIGALKFCKDAVAEQWNPGLEIGQADNDDQLHWHYKQFPYQWPKGLGIKIYYPLPPE